MRAPAKRRQRHAAARRRLEAAQIAAEVVDAWTRVIISIAAVS
jgi:hypothetical protein